MNDKPILFSGPMVRAIIREIEHPGTGKTQTRRVAPTPPPECSINYMLGNESWLPIEQRSRVRRTFEAWGGDLFNRKPERALCGLFEIVPRIQPGDRLWVRETLSVASNDQGKRWLSYAADGKDVWPLTEWLKLRDSVPSIHMPRWASRITLIVTDVRVERLQDISEFDARAEGVERVEYDGDHPQYVCLYGFRDYRDHPHAIVPFRTAKSSFQTLWDSLNGKRPGCHWQDNPWVAAYTFKPILGNIDQVRP